MFFSLIVCTLGERKSEFKRLILSLEQQTFKDFEIIVLSQRNHQTIKELLNESTLKIQHIKLKKAGLSYARNQGIQYCSGKYITISDDDCWYPQDSLERVKKEIESKEQKLDVFSFKIFDPINSIPFKNNYSNKEKVLGQYSVTQCSSIEIFLKKEITNHIQFDENFGVGSKYPSGEENIFLIDALRKGYKIGYIPMYIVFHKARTIRQTEFDLFFLKTKYHLFKRMYGNLKGTLLYYIFFIKKLKFIKHKTSGLFPDLFNNPNLQS